MLRRFLQGDAVRRRAGGIPPPVPRSRHHHHWASASASASSSPIGRDRRPPQSRASAVAIAAPRHRPFSISRHPDPLARHGTINSLDDDDDDDADVDADPESLDGGGKKVLTADDMDYLDEFLGIDDLRGGKKGGKKGGQAGGGGDYDDIFAPDDDDDDDDYGGPSAGRKGNALDEEEKEDAEYRAKQAKISEELDKRTGRLWTESWTITDEEWMADEAWDDIEDWKPSLATRKSLESVRVYSSSAVDGAVVEGAVVGGVPTLEAMSALTALPKSLPPHPGHGNPAAHASHRKRSIKRKLRTSIQIAIHDDLLKITNGMTTYDERQAAVDVLYETIVDRVREREPVLGKLPDFASMVEDGLEDVLTMVRDRMARMAKEEKKKAWEMAKAAKKGEEDVGGGGAPPPPGVVGKVDEKVIDVMGVSEEEPTPIFMDVLAATRHLQRLRQPQQQGAQSDDGDAGGTPPDQPSPPPSAPSVSLPGFFSQINDDGVPNLLYPLNVHPKMGVGRMVEEWQLAANKETKRIMMRDAMREIASIVVEAMAAAAPAPESGASAADDASRVATTGGAARVLVTGKRGVGKVRERESSIPFLPSWRCLLLPPTMGHERFPTPRVSPPRPPPILISSAHISSSRAPDPDLRPRRDCRVGEALRPHRGLPPRRRPPAQARVLHRAVLPPRRTLQPPRNRQGILRPAPHESRRGPVLSRVRREGRRRRPRRDVEVLLRRSGAQVDPQGVRRGGRVGYDDRGGGVEGDGHVPQQAPNRGREQHLALVGVLLRGDIEAHDPDGETVHGGDGRVQLLLRPRSLLPHGLRRFRAEGGAPQQDHHPQAVHGRHGAVPRRGRDRHGQDGHGRRSRRCVDEVGLHNRGYVGIQGGTAVVHAVARGLRARPVL